MADNETKVFNLLIKIAEEQDLQSFDIKLKPISSGGANYTSLLYVASITSINKDTLELFIKVATKGEKMRSGFLSRIYEVEYFVYTKLLPKYKRLEEKHGIAENDRLRTCKYYAASTVPMEEILVLENLEAKDFTSHNRIDSMDWDTASVATGELAKLHALSMVLAHENAEEFNKLFQFFQHDKIDFKDMNDFYETCKETALKAVRKDNFDRLAKFLNGITFGDVWDYYNVDKVAVLVHGDFRLSNLLQRVKNDVTAEKIIVDYQTFRCGCPVVDLLYFIFTGTDQQFRAQYYQQLVEHYYSELRAALTRLGLNPDEKYSREDFESELNKKLAFGLAISIFTLPVLTIDSENVPELNEHMELTDIGVENTGTLYPERLNEVVDDYVKWGII